VITSHSSAVSSWCCLVMLFGCARNVDSRGHGSDAQCKVYVSTDCNSENADAVVRAEVAIAQDGTGSLVRVVSVTPQEHQLTPDEMAQLRGRMSLFYPEGPRTSIDNYAICDHPLVDIQAYGRCPPKEKLAQQSRAKGYRVHSVWVDH